MEAFEKVEKIILAQKETGSVIEIDNGAAALSEINTNMGKKIIVEEGGAGFDITVEDGNIDTPSFELIFDKGFVNLEAGIQEGDDGDVFVLSIIGTDDVRDALFGEQNAFLINMQDSPVYIKTEGDKVIIRKERIVPEDTDS